jgi:hypothetical protein
MSRIAIAPLQDTSPAGIQQWARQLSQQVERLMNGIVADINASPVRAYTVDTLPSPTETKRIIYVIDETGGAVLAFNDGTDWRRVTDRAVVS